MTGSQESLFPDTSPQRYGNGRRRQRLFLPKLLAGAASDQRLAGPSRDNAHQILIKWADLESSGRLFKMSETALHGEFLSDVFGKALGYTFFSENLPQWQIQAEFAVPAGHADAAIGLFSSGGENVPRAVVELKGPTVDLDRHRDRGRTPVQQCWDYLYAVPACPWGIVCNYVSFRLYHREKTPQAYELFTLQDLRNPGRFSEFYAIFGRGGLLPLLEGQRPRADQLLYDTDHQQREVGKQLYATYRDERIELIKFLSGKPHNKSLEEAIPIVQKLLDRIIFIAFCEDRDLLPSEAILRTWSDTPPFTQVTNPKWQNFKQLFRIVDEGSEERGITKYNGGLFRVDPEVDDLELPDARTNFFKKISAYDFRDEVNVDVLGHLFEQSITDLEAMRADPDAFLSPRQRKVSGKRKREGIYYTPPNITRYIVKETVGSCIDEYFLGIAKELKIDPSADPDPKRSTLWKKYNEQRLAALQQLRVCDPACGSGAFLIEAYDYLEDAYDEVVTALCLHQDENGEKLYEEISRTILRENLFGVDASHEAVEITQLALWIRSARRGRSLSDLSGNIKCGNSLVDDTTVDSRAFDWQGEFSSVLDNGGFDCIIGNPPYIKLQNFRKRQPKIAAFLVKRYRSAQSGNFDMYLPFIERGLELVSAQGRMGFIAPNVWLFNQYGRGLREMVAKNATLERFVDFKSHQVFEDATTYTALQFFSKRSRKAIEVADAGHGDVQKLEFYNVPYAVLGKGAWALLNRQDQAILDRMRENAVTLGDATEQIFQGIITSADSVYHLIKLGPGKYYSKELNEEVEIEDEIAKPLVSGEDAVPFATPPTDKRLIFPYLVTAEECRLHTSREMFRKYKRCWAYLKRNEKKLRARERGKFDDDAWYRFGRNQGIDKQERAKILVPRLLYRLRASGDPRGATYIDNVAVGGILLKKTWKLHYLLALLNSKACDFAWRATSKPFRGEYRSANKQFIAPLPIPKARDQKPLADLARKLASLHAKRLKSAAAVHRRFVIDLPPPMLLKTSPLPPNLSGRLQAFDETPMARLLKEMEKLAERRMKPAERDRWDEYLTKQSQALTKIKGGISDLMSELNDRVYRLYGLDADQIKIIEAW